MHGHWNDAESLIKCVAKYRRWSCWTNCSVATTIRCQQQQNLTYLHGGCGVAKCKRRRRKSRVGFVYAYPSAKSIHVITPFELVSGAKSRPATSRAYLMLGLDNNWIADKKVGWQIVLVLKRIQRTAQCGATNQLVSCRSCSICRSCCFRY